MTLLVLAAGMGSRYGGIKQIESVGEEGELIIDYSVFDAIRAGFDKVVFVIRKEIEEDFCKRFFNRIKHKINAQYVFQEIPKGRKKPLGTTEAVLKARHVIDGPFCVINADDFYGQSAYKLVADFFRASPGQNVMVGHKLKNTISNFGAVNRGIIEHDGKGTVKEINERKNIVREDGKMFYITNGKDYNELKDEALASMTFFGLTPSVFPMLQQKFDKFIKDASETSECIIAQDIGDLVKEGKMQLSLVEALDDWYGFTYPEDREKVSNAVRSLSSKYKHNITVVGSGYVGLALAVLLAKKHNVIAFDINKSKVDKINKRESFMKDMDLERMLSEDLSLVATTCEKTAYKNAEFVIIAAPTDFDELTNCFNTSIIDSIIKSVKNQNKNATIVIKSTVPVGYTSQHEGILFSPEFLREGKSIHDNLYPSRIIVGQGKGAKQFAGLMKEISKNDAPVLFMSSTEAEAVKIFSNTYLASRIAFFNELDTFAEIKGLDSKNIINGVSLDPRIGDYYNNPSFGFGGYCLPKDTKQLRQHFKGIPENIMGAIIESNRTRKKFIADQIAKKGKVIGVYRLTMKANSDNFRSSAIRDVLEHLSSLGLKIFIYEPTLGQSTFEGYPILNDFAKFKAKADVIVANRMNAELYDVKNKVYTRDIFERD